MPEANKESQGRAWTRFAAWADGNGVNLDDEEDYGMWWSCFKAGFATGVNHAFTVEELFKSKSKEREDVYHQQAEEASTESPTEVPGLPPGHEQRPDRTGE